ncbi:MAG: bifunctional glycosyltransferase family 2/GtrA family protein [Ilumatobacter sp.]|nr:bifunctional glycosyltransferase family 2/GtrA family protein [Ilumatobacter sp.]
MPSPALTGPCADAPAVDVTVPVYNEEHVLRSSIERLHAYLSESLPWTWRITIADNASTDGTRAAAHALAGELPGVRVVGLDRKGRGLALRAAWTGTDAEVVAYMDVDLSTGLEALAPMVAAIRSGHSEVAIGSRLAPGAAVARGPRREFISRTYNRILRAIFLTRFRDAQCGFKAVRADVAQALLPLVEDNAWFFDTELLLLAEHNGLRILEVPVDWVDDPDSRVHVVATARDDLRGVVRVFASFLRGRGRAALGAAARPGLADDMGRQLVTFLKVGVLSTLASLAIYLLARTEWSAGVSAAVAFGLVAAVNSWANRRYTFGHHARADRMAQVARLTVTFLLGISVSVAAAMLADGDRLREAAALVGVWVPLAVVRFALLRAWVFRRRGVPSTVQRTRWSGGGGQAGDA